MSSSKPTVVLIAGGFHGPFHWEEVITRLNQADFPTLTLPLPTLNPPDPSTADVAKDTVFVREQMLLPLLDAGKDVLLVMHSYGGLAGNCSAKGLSKKERSSAGHEGGVIGLVFITAFVAKEGSSLFVMSEGRPDPFVVIHKDKGVATTSNPKHWFYQDVPEPLATKAVDALLPHSLLAFASPCPAPAWEDASFNGRRAYIRCLQDRTMPPARQDRMLKASGVEWEIRDFDTSHSPFLSRPTELVASLEELVDIFNKAT